MLTLEDKVGLARNILNAVRDVGGIRDREIAQMEILKVLQDYNISTRNSRRVRITSESMAKAFNLENS